MEASQITPGCYYHTAAEWDQNLISTRDFFSNCLSHLGSPDTRVRHPEDVESVNQQLDRMFWKGKFGPVAAAIKLCEYDDLAESIDVERLVPLFMECTFVSQSIEAIETLDDQNVLASPFFRQAFIVTALQTGNESLIRDLVNHAPVAPPPPETCMFKMQRASLEDAEGISAGTWAALIKTRWALPTRRHSLWAAGSSNGADGVALLNAVVAAGWDMHANPISKKTVPAMALTHGEPEVLEYLFDLYSVVPTDDMLIQAVELRKTGGVGNLRLLLDKYHLDVNYVRQGFGLGDRPPPITDPRERAEWEWARRQAGSKRKPKTALEAAEIRGDTEAYEFLLARGASRTAGYDE
ncbi:uncharacterized protein GGS22DRAFT_185157 [Annulohypoxylon maeteangense]|uniref:uncharacterized protein n=1 Tax=Annulohypoxylon maeteangense TaxID=1927788 RepID=UPI0020089C37|nr:uncharacterized protein GGS22DRAFT_185157 [Annulohypoxylon maeteangense]KAI0887778.1 hypothetical protein GGS22DRAFT_185157 [Annulohypoxylon maeteangense]